MKTAMFTLFLLFAFTSSAAADFLLDTDGNLLRNGGDYYILPDIWAKGGGLGLASTGNETCPLTVIQHFSEVNNGLPLKISSPARILYLHTNLVLSISFTAVPVCASTPSTWTVVVGEDETKSVKITGYNNTLKGGFQIKKYNDVAYKIVFRTTDGEFSGNVGISKDDDGNRHLVITDDDPFAVVFVNAGTSAAA